MQITLSKVLSLLVAISYVVFAISFGGPTYWAPLVGLLVPLAFIWFPDEIGNITGYFDSGYVNTRTPGVMIALTGWFLLVGIPLILYLLRSRLR